MTDKTDPKPKSKKGLRLAPSAFRGTDAEYLDNLLARSKEQVTKKEKKKKDEKLLPTIAGLLERGATPQEIQESLKLAGWNFSYPRVNQLIKDAKDAETEKKD